MNVSPVSSDKRLYRFDRIVVDPVRRLLLRDGDPVAITPKAFSLLLALIEQRGEVVDKRELLQQVWPDTFVTEANLTQNISSLRKALGERAGEHRYILTVPGRGYSFVAESFEVAVVDEGPAEAAEPVPTNEPEETLPAAAEEIPPQEPVGEPAVAPDRVPRWRVAAAVLLGVLGLGAVAALLMLLRGSGPGPELQRDGAGPRRPVVAVLPFRNSSGTRSLNWLGPALADMITTELTAGARLRLISGHAGAQTRQVLLPFTAQDPPDERSLEQLRSRFGVDYVVQGSFVALQLPQTEYSLRVDFRIVDARTGEVTASVNETGTEAQVSALVTRAGVKLREALVIGEVSPEDVRAVRAARSPSTEAMRLYTQGLELLRTSSYAAARLSLEQAARADPSSAPIRAALSRAWSELGYEARAVTEARKAVELSRSLSMAEKLAIEGWSHEAAKDWPQAIEDYRSLWTFFPDDVEYGLRLASALTRGGRPAEALQTIAELRRLPPPDRDDPRIDIMEALAAQRLSDAATQLRAAQAAEAKGRRSGENLIAARALLLQGAAYLNFGRAQEAVALVQQAKALYEKAGDRWGVTLSLAYTGLLQQQLGDLAGAEASYQSALQLAQKLGNAAAVAAQLGILGTLYQDQGDLSQALDYLERSQAKLAELGDRQLESRVVLQIAGIHKARGDLNAASVRLEQALVMSRNVRSRFDEAKTLAEVGNVTAARGWLKRALGYHEESLRILHELGNAAESTVLWNSGDVLVRLGDLAKAQVRYEKALAAKRQEGDRVGTGRVLGSLARLAFYRGNLAASRSRSEEQLRLGRETRARSLEAQALEVLGRLDLAANPSAPSAQKQLATSLQVSRDIGEILNAEAARLDWACLLAAQGKTDEALQITARAAEWFHARGIPASEARALGIQARILLRQRQLAKAGLAAGRIRELVRAYREDRLLLADVAPVLARIRAAQGDPEGARGELRQAFAEATKRGIVPAALEARLALGEIELAHGDGAKARRDLDAVRQEAEALGFDGTAKNPLMLSTPWTAAWTIARKGERRTP